MVIVVKSKLTINKYINILNYIFNGLRTKRNIRISNMRENTKLENLCVYKLIYMNVAFAMHSPSDGRASLHVT